MVDFGFDVDDAVPFAEMTDGDFVADSVRLPSLCGWQVFAWSGWLVTGSARYPGAAVLSARAAACANVGMVRYLGPQRAQDMILAVLPEAVLGKGRVQSVVGSGVPAEGDVASGDDMQRATIAALLDHYALEDGDGSRNERAEGMPPIVVDAGALDLLPCHAVPQVVITPHAGESGRIAESVDADMADVVSRQWVRPGHCGRRCARMSLRGHGAAKGAVTIVVGADGDGNTRIILSGRAPAWMATAGSGDVLAGVLGRVAGAAGRHAVRTIRLWFPEVAAAAAYMHGLAGAMASGSEQRGWHRPHLYGHAGKTPASAIGHPIVAGDVVAAVPGLFGELFR